MDNKFKIVYNDIQVSECSFHTEFIYKESTYHLYASIFDKFLEHYEVTDDENNLIKNSEILEIGKEVLRATYEMGDYNIDYFH